MNPVYLNQTLGYLKGEGTQSPHAPATPAPHAMPVVSTQVFIHCL